MPIDPRIPLGVESPALPNPLETLSTVAQIRAVQDNAEIRRQEIELRRQAAEAARTKAREQQRIDLAWQDAVSINPTDGKVKVDRVKLFSALPGHLIPAAEKELDLDDERVLDLQTKRDALTKSQRELVTSMANTIIASKYHPAMVTTQLKRAHAEGLLTDDQFDQLTQADPEEFKTLINSLGTPRKLERVEYMLPSGETVQEYVEPELGAQYLQAPKESKAATIGSLEDYIARWSVEHKRDPKTLTVSELDRIREQYRLDQRPSVTVINPVDKEITDQIVEDIRTGLQPPTTQGLYRYGPAVRAGLARANYNLAAAQIDWEATKRHFSTLNGPQQTRLRQAVDTASHSLDTIEALAKQWKGGRFPLLNRVNIKAAVNGVYGPQAASIAQQMEAQIADVTSELANAYMGGNSPTDHAMALAAKNLSADWSESVLMDMIKLAKTNLQIRRNAIENAGVLGVSPVNPYGGTPVAPPAAATTPAAVPEGTRRAIPGVPGGEAEMRGGKWIRVK